MTSKNTKTATNNDGGKTDGGKTSNANENENENESGTGPIRNAASATTNSGGRRNLLRLLKTDSMRSVNDSNRSIGSGLSRNKKRLLKNVSCYSTPLSVIVLFACLFVSHSVSGSDE